MNLLDVAVGRRTLVVIALALGSTLLMAADSPRAHGRVIVTETSTTILDVVAFAPGTATLCTKSLATLDAVAETLKGNPSIELVEVQAHMRTDGDADGSLELSQDRADVVVDYLIHAGVAPGRLVAQGYGQTQPLDAAVPAKNERVAFLILKRAGDPAAP
ncbi:MAG TPA: OmpA family protein [Kofleriaceae bacterium]|jgi:outer membrane protein OmpA-like peptidoglycan-associated protein